MLYLLLGILGLGIGLSLWLQLRPREPQSESEIARRKAELEGQNKQMYAQVVDLKAQLTQNQKEKDALQRQLAKHEEAAERKDREHKEEVARLAQAEKSFQEERARVIREEEMKRSASEADRDRVWADHEVNVIAHLTGLCKSPALGFPHYTNVNLPDGFDGSLKPDFMVECLGQYVIFDAKASKAESLQTYISNAVKETVKKVKRNERIASTIFLVVPTQAIHELKAHHYSLDGYNLYVICPEALGPILASLKRISAYELAEQLDPQKRENLINLIAEMDFHINLRNGTDLYFTQSGINVLEKAQKIDPELFAEAQLKKQEMKVPAFSDLKKLAGDLAAQQETVSAMASPKARVPKKEIERAAEAIMKRLG
jgi:hypothetical protein